MTEPLVTDPQHDPQLVALQQQCQQLMSQVQALTARVASLESKLILIPDLERYGKLQEFLAAGDFKQADSETTRILLETLDRNRDNLRPEDLPSLPCNVLIVIDRLWQTYSQGRFGFSKQRAAYTEVGGSTDSLMTQDRKIITAFATKIGWVVDDQVRFENYDQWDFSINAPVGQFPAIWWRSPYGLKMVLFFLLRLYDCSFS